MIFLNKRQKKYHKHLNLWYLFYKKFTRMITVSIIPKTAQMIVNILFHFLSLLTKLSPNLFFKNFIILSGGFLILNGG